MEAITQQIAIVTNELEALKAEIIGIKGAHASLHQTTVATTKQHEGVIDEQAAKVAGIQMKIDELAMTAGASKGGSYKSLIEPKNVTVEVFHGSVADSRAKFLSWGERVRDKADLLNPVFGEAMLKAENRNEPITIEESQNMGSKPLVETRIAGGFERPD